MPVELSRIARQGLLKLFDDAERRMSFELAIRHHLSTADIWQRSRQLSGPKNVLLYVYPLVPARVVWEQISAKHVVVWSVTKLKSLDGA